ncbi:hypothetical protein LTR91_021001 [Friedmanniomyces endolithicus]|uniref:Bacterial low temperature requirement A protein-domain-containing protein n=1 Tax=Friedmanniomyces endolithicus TaxID=329885 RepID=A0AAN6K3J3_9PEZI|nr:hypothetical protein LTR91_021001 [Friedmanniomyces endolithicus]
MSQLLSGIRQHQSGNADWELAQMAKHKNPPLRQSVIPTAFDYPSAQTLLHSATQKCGKSGTQRAHEKHQHDLDAARTPSTASLSLADRFHALPSELRTHIFSFLLVRPAKWDVLHGPSCELPMSDFGIMLHPRYGGTPFNCQSCNPAQAFDHRWTFKGSWETLAFVSPWRSKYAPPQLNPYICTDCYDEKWRTCPQPRSLPCLCARRSDLDVLLVCRKWHEEAGEVFYRANTFCFEDTDALAGFVAKTRPKWCRAVTRVSLMAWSNGPDLSDRDDYDWEGVETLEPRTMSLLRQALPNLAYIELDARCLANVKYVRTLLRVGLMQRRVVVHFALPARKRRAIFGPEGDAEYPWPRLANRLLLRGGFPEEVARAMKGERRAWMKAGGKKAGRSAVDAACEDFRAVLAAVEGERVGGEGGRKGWWDCCDVKLWEEWWHRIGLQHAWLPISPMCKLRSLVAKEPEALKVMSAEEIDGEMIGEGFVRDVAGEDSDVVDEVADAPVLESVSMTSSPADPEKQIAFATDHDDSPSPPKRPGHPPRHFGHEAQAKLRHFLHPDGKRIHVAQSPEEALRLRAKLARLHQEDEFDVYISGTPEHLAAIRQAKQHHEARRATLQTEHKDVYERFADVHAELDNLSRELERVTTHGVNLEAHFSRFGYDAHVKSYDDEESPSHSGASTPRSGVAGGRRGSAEQESDYGSSLKLWKKPVVRQYFHKGILWRASRFEEVQSFELFVDLLYVGILAINGDAVSQDPTGLALLHFVITFSVSWKIWNDMSQIISWFETDDIVQRVSIIFLLGCLFGITTNITQAWGENGTYPTLIGFYLASRLFNAVYLVFIAYILPMVRPVMLCHVFIALVGSAFWIASIHVSYPKQLILIWLALFVDLFGPLSVILLKSLITMLGASTKERFDQMFEFWPAINIEHRTERQNAFVTLVFGYTVVAMLYQSTVNSIDGFFAKAILGLIQAFSFNWMYFDIDGQNLAFHAIRRHKISAIIWSMAHLPFIMAFVLGGGALARLVVAPRHRDRQARAPDSGLPGPQRTRNPPGDPLVLLRRLRNRAGVYGCDFVNTRAQRSRDAAAEEEEPHCLALLHRYHPRMSAAGGEPELAAARGHCDGVDSLRVGYGVVGFELLQGEVDAEIMPDEIYGDVWEEEDAGNSAGWEGGGCCDFGE